MSDFINPYLEKYSPDTAEIIFKYENEFRDKVNSGICVDNKVFMEKFIDELKGSYDTEKSFLLEFEKIVNDFSTNNKQYVINNFSNDSTDIIKISMEEFESVPTKSDLELLKFNLEEESEKLEEPKELEELEEHSLIDEIYATLYGINRFIRKDNLDYKNLIIYILRFSTLRKKLIKELSTTAATSENYREIIKELGLDKINDEYISEQMLKSVDQKDIEIILKNNTFYSLKYFKEYN
jgi:hypothetical protein